MRDFFRSLVVALAGYLFLRRVRLFFRRRSVAFFLLRQGAGRGYLCFGVALCVVFFLLRRGVGLGYLCFGRATDTGLFSFQLSWVFSFRRSRGETLDGGGCSMHSARGLSWVSCGSDVPRCRPSVLFFAAAAYFYGLRGGKQVFVRCLCRKNCAFMLKLF